MDAVVTGHHAVGLRRGPGRDLPAGRGRGRAATGCGGPDEAAHQPCWGPDGHLYLLSDRSGWWNLYRCRDQLEAVAPMAAECRAALWESGYASYTFLPGGRIAMIAENGPRSRVLLIGPDGSRTEPATPFTSVKPFRFRQRFGVEPICAMLSEHDMKIAPQTYYRWLPRLGRRNSRKPICCPLSTC